ncbi:MAG TPA: pyridoxal phosphate-dependent aminotransferase [Candidatus Acidoferrales bacterium]|nr:pyridoxal phosphate-dependent aminotransferase [Candidatus Acidoferrales bacterium]
MISSRREIRSAYLEWAKLRSAAKYNLATSGLDGFPLAQLPVRIEDLEISIGGSYGYPQLQDRLARKNGISPESVVAANGTSMANHLAMAALLEPGDEVLIEQPTYEPLLTVAAYLGAAVRRFPRRFEDEFQLDPREVERHMTPRTRLVVVTNLHNPSGARTTDSRLRLIGEIAQSRGAQVLVDEVYLDACFDPHAGSAFHLGHNFIVTSSLTKAFGLSGLRCGWVLAPPPLAERMWRMNDLFGVIPAHVAELLSVFALDNLKEIEAYARTRLQTNRPILQQFLGSRRDLKAIGADAGTIAFPQLASGKVDALCQLLREKYDTAVVPGRFFEMPDHFRIGIGGKTELLEEALKRLGKALDEIAA